MAGRNKKARYQQCEFCGANFSLSLSTCTDCKMMVRDKDYAEDDGTITLDTVEDEPLRVIQTGVWDKILCPLTPGIVSTSVILLGGAPGAGKSTLAVQLVKCFTESTGKEVLYVGTEEGRKEIRNRAKRLGVTRFDLIRLVPIGVNVSLDVVLTRRKPCALIIDSLQGITEDLEQQAQICKNLKDYTVALDAPAIVISQVNKEHDFAGLMALQHHVDTLAIFSVIKDSFDIRMLETRKNRYGPTAGMFLKMTELGLIEYIPPDDDSDE